MNTFGTFAEFANKFGSAIRIQPCRMNIHALMQAFADENLGQQELAKVLHNYPVISARLLSLANSAWARPVMPIINIESACLRLGFSTVKAVSMALAVAPTFDTTRCPSFDPTRFWASSMLEADAGVLLVNELPAQSDHGNDLKFIVQTAGILRNMGLLWLADYMAAETEQALKTSRSDANLSLAQALATSIGVDYCQLSVWIFTQWGLPEQLVAVIAEHKQPYESISSVAAQLLAVADVMVSAVFAASEEIAEQPLLSRLGIAPGRQIELFKQLVDKRDATAELAKTLFV
jgi:HD-like signal output (HDOD) protein